MVYIFLEGTLIRATRIFVPINTVLTHLFGYFAICIPEVKLNKDIFSNPFIL